MIVHRFLNGNHRRLSPAFLLLAFLAFAAGCDNQLRTEYGASRGVEGDQSINGFGALRRTFNNRGWSTRDVNRLNERMANVDALVWIPDSRDSLHGDAVKWLEDWLSSAPRTLVYLVPDDGCEVEYFEAARELTEPTQRLEYRRRLARLETDEMISRLRQESIPENGWFALEYMPEGESINGVSGKWKRTTHEDTKWGMTGTELRVPGADYRIVPPSSNPSTASSSTPATYGMDQGTSSAQMERETLLATSDDSVIVSRITAAPWGASKIIVVSSGSLLCNYSLATSAGQAMAANLIQEVGDSSGTVAFMSTDFRGALISDIDPEINATTGMELFTVWPLSLVMLHLAVMGFVACMILVPIFGRPREGDRDSTSDFGDHLDAVATLMVRSGGEDFARRRVSDYMRRIRGEVAGEWLIPETKTPVPTVPGLTIPVPTQRLAMPVPSRQDESSSEAVANATHSNTPTTLASLSPDDLSTSNKKETP